MTMRAVDRLPNEILIEVASNLDMADLLSISQTHRSWRQILTSAPRLWTKLTVKSEVKRPSHHQLIKLFEHILMVAERSQHSLEYVVLRVHSPGHWAKQVHHILQLSAATLNHIELYAPNQPFMYTQLYRFCPLLRKLVFLDDDEVSIPVTPVTAQMLPVKDLPPITQHEAEPFHLEEFHANKDEDDDPQMDKHLDKVRVLTRFNPFRCHVKAGVVKLDDEQLVCSITEHLEHWQYPQIDGQAELPEDPPDYRPLTIRLPQLKTLLDLELQPHSIQLRFNCPNLLEMRVLLYEGAYDTAEELAETLNSTTRLQNLTFDNCDLLEDEILLTALRMLTDLRYLNIATADCHMFAAELLLPYAVSTTPGDSELVWPFPKLLILLISGVELDIRKVPRSLWIRELVRKGFGLSMATQIVSDHISIYILDPHHTSALFHVNPLANNSSLTSNMDQGPRLKDASCYTRLQELVVQTWHERPIPGATTGLLRNVTERLVSRLI